MIRRAGLAGLLILSAATLMAADPVAPAPVHPPASQAASKPAPAPTPRKTAPPKPAAKPLRTCTPLPRSSAGPLPFEVFRDCADTPEMVRLPAGRFTMGEGGVVGHTYELPLREVEVPAFSIGRYEVSFAEWDECHRDGGCQTLPDDEGWGRGNRPVINVSWVDAKQYVTWLSNKTGEKYRLPSEAEWEFAVRAGTTSPFHWGEASGEACRHGNGFDRAAAPSYPHWFWSIHCSDGFVNTAPVGSFVPNAWGLHDMTGNVWEWVEDCWHSDYTGAPSDGSAWVTGPDCGKRVNRGGGWGNHARSMRSANRDADSATGTGDAFGFRVARDDPPQPAGAPQPAMAPKPASSAPPGTAVPTPKPAASSP